MSKNVGDLIRVLVVDDEESNIVTIGSILDAQGYTVLAAKDGEEALAIATSGQPDIMLLDVQMPGLNGHEMARFLSTNEQTSSIPIVMVTGLSSLEERLSALKAGAVDFLTKPVDPAELQAKVASLARLKGYNNEMNPEFVDEATRLIEVTDVDRARLSLFDGDSKRQLFGPLNVELNARSTGGIC